MIAFEIQLPQNAKRSFNADHSEFYWLLEAKLILMIDVIPVLIE